MNIAINTIAVGIAGGKYHVKMMLRNVLLADSKDKYFIFLSSKHKNELILHSENITFLDYSFPAKNLLYRFIWEQIRFLFLLKKYDIDILYNFSGVDIFFAPCKTIITISNMAPYSKEVISCEKDIKSKLRLVILNILTKISSKTANAVITLSNSALNELVKHKNFPNNKIKAILHGVDIDDLKGKELPSEIKSKISGCKYILCVSHIYRYKKFENIILAYKKAIKDFRNIPKLLIVGAPKDKRYFIELKDLVKRESLNDTIFFCGLIARESLFELYNSCEFLIFNSIVETCPLTLIEALKCGTPILCSHGGPMVEICNDAAFYFNANDHGELAEKILCLLQNKHLLRELKLKSQRRGKHFSWEKTAREALNVFQEIYNSSK